MGGQKFQRGPQLAKERPRAAEYLSRSQAKWWQPSAVISSGLRMITFYKQRN